MPLVVVAIGGNSLVKASQKGTIAEQFENAATTMRQLADVIAGGFDIVLTHGNGPQVGNVLLRVELAMHQVYPLPLDVCDADTVGGMGYMLQQTLCNELRRREQERTVVTCVTQVRVDAADPAFQKPTKPIGPFFTREAAEQKTARLGWKMVEDSGRGYRRVVPSPKPVDVIEIDAVRKLIAAKVIPIAVGGGGVPVVETDGMLHGVEAVIDKDLASALLGNLLGAETLLISTGVDAVQVNYGKPSARALETVSRAELRKHLADGQFPAGSMGPKIEAALAFLDRGGRQAIISSPERLADALAGKTGTRVT
ncbi:MAG: carbamate kinase [Deltaproteobacteria bacterium]|nr:carbamate kinase [Deltaproteobacteria bacterium]